jgi:hypothetical protein
LKKLQCCCIAVPVGLLALVAVLGIYLTMFRFTVHQQIDGQRLGAQALVFGKVQDTVSVPLLGTAYLLDDGRKSVWVLTKQPLPQRGRHVLSDGQTGSGVTIPGKLGGGALLVHLNETRRWDLPL